MGGMEAKMAAGAAPASAGLLLEAARDLLGRLDDERLAPFLADWTEPALPDRQPAPAGLPVLRWLPDAARLAPAATAPLVRALAQAAGHLAWRQTYTADDLGPEFLERYGWTELVGLRGPVASERLACGFLLLGPATEYPTHRHEAEEVYVPLAGTALWRAGEGSCTPRPPGTVIHHPAWTPHAMRTRTEPLLALYLWRGGDLAQKSRLVLRQASSVG
jgi:mannose-6-phosphate isomerase-like protein (cupin superfamily)